MKRTPTENLFSYSLVLLVTTVIDLSLSMFVMYKLFVFYLETFLMASLISYTLGFVSSTKKESGALNY